MNRQSFKCRHSIRRKFHHKRSGRAFNHRNPQQLGNQQRSRPCADGNHKHDQRFVLGKKGGDQKGEYRQFGSAIHKRYGQQGGQPLAR